MEPLRQLAQLIDDVSGEVECGRMPADRALAQVWCLATLLAAREVTLHTALNRPSIRSTLRWLTRFAWRPARPPGPSRVVPFPGVKQERP